ncbi:SGNH hydrolase-type esterase domain-containing protein [Aspergillus granulosus]|uniref:SGNH hydrolase-type esterase domain-containing protein n=1 Tax=Aspergillus granulosus TaxID=176169 RepID=A0ABR4GTK9_9EURO
MTAGTAGIAPGAADVLARVNEFNSQAELFEQMEGPDTAQLAPTITASSSMFDSQPADLMVINIGTNDDNNANNVSSTDYYNDYVKLVGDIQPIQPNAQIVLMSLWGGFGATGDTYAQGPLFVSEIQNVYKFYRHKGGKFVHYFDTMGILQHNDIAPQRHPTDVGHIKVAAHFMQWVKLTFGWEMEAMGPMVHSGTSYWNDQDSY